MHNLLDPTLIIFSYIIGLGSLWHFDALYSIGLRQDLLHKEKEWKEKVKKKDEIFLVLRWILDLNSNSFSWKKREKKLLMSSLVVIILVLTSQLALTNSWIIKLMNWTSYFTIIYKHDAPNWPRKNSYRNRAIIKKKN